MTERERLARRLRDRREYLGFTQEQVATYLGLARPAVSEIEAGRRNVTAEELAKLARLFASTADRLLCDDATAPLPDALLPLVEGLEACDREELALFADFLRHRKAVRERKT